MPTGDILRGDPAAMEDVAPGHPLLADTLTSCSTNPGAMSRGPANRADVLAQAVVEVAKVGLELAAHTSDCLLYTSPSPRD
eukprot:14538258-Alexandrium_andersonii.AAC.1